MNNFIRNYLNILKKNNFDFPDIELKALLNNTSKSQKEIFFCNFNENNIDVDLFKKAFHRRLNAEPISKIFNKKYFWKHKFYVNKYVLDPRPESELLIVFDR